MEIILHSSSTTITLSKSDYDDSEEDLPSPSAASARMDHGGLLLGADCDALSESLCTSLLSYVAPRDASGASSATTAAVGAATAAMVAGWSQRSLHGVTPQLPA